MNRATKDAATAPTMVMWLWARRELAKDGIAEVDRPALAVATAGIHLLMFKLLASRRRSGAPRPGTERRAAARS